MTYSFMRSGRLFRLQFDPPATHSISAILYRGEHAIAAIVLPNSPGAIERIRQQSREIADGWNSLMRRQRIRPGNPTSIRTDVSLNRLITCWNHRRTRV